MPDRTNQDVAIEVGVKFDFYMVALTFTVFAFAIQSGSFRGNVIIDIIEALSWLCLLCSGMVGLSRLELIPVMYRAKHQLDKTLSDTDLVEQLATMQERHIPTYRVQRWALVLGMAALVVSRLMTQLVMNY